MAASNATNPSLMRTRKLTGLAIFTAVIVVLQILCTFVRFGPFSITLALTPIVIGAAVYGAGSGAFLGFVMGLVVLITGILGWDGGTVNYLISINAFSTILLIPFFSSGPASDHMRLREQMVKKLPFAKIFLLFMLII